MSYPKDRLESITLQKESFWGKWWTVAHATTLWGLLKMLKETGRWEMWDLSKRHQEYDDAGGFSS